MVDYLIQQHYLV